MGKILAIVWAIVGVLALLVLAAPDLVALGFFLLIIPGIILAAMPTVFLYVSIFCGVWFAVRRKGDWAATGAGILASAIVAVEVPILLNGVTERRLAEAAALEAAPPKPAPELAAVPIPVVVIEFSGRSSANPGCDELCQLLLYNDIAAKVEVRPAFTPSKKPRPPKVYRIVRDDCSIDAETLKSLRESSWERWTDAAKAKEIARAVRGRIAGEECLAVEEGPAGAENVRVRYLDDWIGNAEAKLALEPGGVWVKGVEIRNGARILARETVRGAAPLLMPLHLEPISSGLGFSGWRWGRKPKPSTPPALDRLAILRRFTPWDLDHPWAGGSTAIRRRLDQALAHPGGSNAAFILLPDYYELLREDEALDKDDRARLARLILDERVEDFSYFHWSEKQRTRVGDVIRDAFLRRMLAEQGRSKKAVTSRLDALAGNLSPGTYAAPAPWLDELLRDPHERRFYPNLVKRLADQGSAGGEKLVAILEQAWGLPDQGHAWGRDAEAATEGLCRLGDTARPLLPRLRDVDARYQRIPFVQGHAWRGLLIALGADPAAFPSKSRRDPARYADELRAAARSCAAKASRPRSARIMQERGGPDETKDAKRLHPTPRPRRTRDPR